MIDTRGTHCKKPNDKPTSHHSTATGIYSGSAQSVLSSEALHTAVFPQLRVSKNHRGPIQETHKEFTFQRRGDVPTTAIQNRNHIEPGRVCQSAI